MFIRQPRSPASSVPAPVAAMCSAFFVTMVLEISGYFTQNVLYLDVESIPEFAHCEEARTRFASGEFQSALAALRAAPLVEYEAVAHAKLPMLELLYAQARRDAASGAPSGWIAFDAFKTEGGDALRHHALFEALQAHFARGGATASGWPAWPSPYRDPDGPAVRAFADAHADRVDFHAWLQWQAALQRAHAAARTRARSWLLRRPDSGQSSSLPTARGRPGPILPPSVRCWRSWRRS